MNIDKREILDRVARGELSPQDAAELLDRLDPDTARPQAAVADPDPAAADPGYGEASAPAARIRVARNLGRVEISGDHGVREAVAEGPHVARREGDTLVIEGVEHELGEAWFAFNSRSWQEDFRRPVRVRVNPDLPLEVRSQAGSVRIRGVRGPIRAEVQAGMTQIDDFSGPLDLSAQAGTIRATGRMSTGASRVRCDAGSVFLDLDNDSSVRMTAHATLGKVVVDGAVMTDTGWLIGDGQATLDVDATMGSIRVQARS
ncbi:MAG: DUF2089 domain-containing protein [Candidatus Dormibacteraeota bacterium]|nr:DUF2089 domain-containing protein [Candidatus Dormibacteraeota bacterium]